MDSVPINCDNTDVAFNREVSIIIDLLQSGHLVELPANGYSMYPTLKPGDKIIVRSLSDNEELKSGNIVVYKDRGGLVMHRLIRTYVADDARIFVVTRGDSRSKSDLPFPQKNILGVAVSYIRRTKRHKLSSHVPMHFQYLYNMGLFWTFHKIRRFISLFA